MNNVVQVDFTDRRVQKRIESLTPEQQLKMHTLVNVFDKDHVAEMLAMASDMITMGEAIDAMFVFVALKIYGGGEQ